MTNKISGAGITVPTPPPVSPVPFEQERNAFFRDIREMLATLDPKTSQHDCMQILISACIDQGYDSRPQITGVAAQLGFDKAHAVIILTRETGHRWQVGVDGRYSNLI